ncbi:MAG TPA: hypothetical protein VGV59_11325, partial [Pyrinomonadaceae bacterium]|nr:hypothetical protein [Pyrinomonadaceae bacterium]
MQRNSARLFTTLLILLSLCLCAQTSAQRRPGGRSGGGGNNNARRVDLLVRGGTVVTMDGERRVFEDGAVAVAGGRIVAVGRRADIERRYTAAEVIDAAGRAVIPGLINGHTHI